MDITTICFTLLTLLLILAGAYFLFWLVNAVRDTKHTISTVGSLRAGENTPSLLKASSRMERARRLVMLPAPRIWYTRGHGLLPDDVKTADIGRLLETFEQKSVRAAGDFGFVLLDSKYYEVAQDSFVTVDRLSNTTRFYGWIHLQSSGSRVEWTLYCSETRLSRTPSEEESHFEYHPKSYEGEGAVVRALWDLVSSNVTTPEVAKRAKRFQDHIEQLWLESVAHELDCDRAAKSAISNTASAPGPSTRRPVRRD